MTTTTIRQTQKERHHDEVGLAAFTEAMHAKLAIARQKGRYGWHDETTCGLDHLRELLRAQVDDPLPEDWDLVDIANFAMMLWNRKQFDEPAPTRTPVQQFEDRGDYP